MFCPECGRVYRSKEVCPHCGKKLLRAKGKPENKERKQRDLSVKTRPEIRCPKCKSNRYFVHERERYRPFMRGKSIILALAMIALYVYDRLCVKREEYVCLDCGHKWQ